MVCNLVRLAVEMKQLYHAQHKIYSEKSISSASNEMFNDCSNYSFEPTICPYFLQLLYFISSFVVNWNWKLTSTIFHCHHLNLSSFWMNLGNKSGGKLHLISANDIITTADLIITVCFRRKFPTVSIIPFICFDRIIKLIARMRNWWNSLMAILV